MKLSLLSFAIVCVSSTPYSKPVKGPSKPVSKPVSTQPDMVTKQGFAKVKSAGFVSILLNPLTSLQHICIGHYMGIIIQS